MHTAVHPIYGDLVYRKQFDVTGNWFLVDGDAPLATVEWYVDDGATAQEVVDRMVTWKGTAPSVEAVEKIAAARQAFWQRERQAGA